MLPIGVFIVQQSNGKWRIECSPQISPSAGSLSREYDTREEAYKAAEHGIYY